MTGLTWSYGGRKSIHEVVEGSAYVGARSHCSARAVNAVSKKQTLTAKPGLMLAYGTCSDESKPRR